LLIEVYHGVCYKLDSVREGERERERDILYNKEWERKEMQSVAAPMYHYTMYSKWIASC